MPAPRLQDLSVSTAVSARRECLLDPLIATPSVGSYMYSFVMPGDRFLVDMCVLTKCYFSDLQWQGELVSKMFRSRWERRTK